MHRTIVGTARKEEVPSAAGLGTHERGGGAAVAVFHRGELVVKASTGTRDSADAPSESDTTATHPRELRRLGVQAWAQPSRLAAAVVCDVAAAA